MKQATTLKRLLCLTLLCAAVPFASGCGTAIMVPPGSVGLVVNHYSGEINGKVRQAGYNGQMPLSGNQFIEIPTYQRTYTMVRGIGEGTDGGKDDSVMVNTGSQNVLNVDASITYHIRYDAGDVRRDERIITLYRKYRAQFRGNGFDNFEQVQLRPAFRQAIVNAFGAQPTTKAMTGAGKREASDYAVKQLNERFVDDGLVIDEVRIRAIYPDARSVSTLRSRLAAQQNLRLASLNQQLQALENEKAVLKATAEARAAQIRARSLTPRLVKYRHLKHLNIVGVPQGAIVNAAAPTLTSSTTTEPVSRAAPNPTPAPEPSTEE